MKTTNKNQSILSRRDALKTLAAAAGAAGLSMLPEQWQAPVVKVGTLPAHAQTSAAVRYRLVDVRQLTACENRGKHHIFINVLDSAGHGINGVPVRIEWSPTKDGYVVVRTASETYFDGSFRDGLAIFAMFKGSYSVMVLDGASEIAAGLTPDYAVNEYCDGMLGNYLYHLSFEVVFERDP